MGCHTWSYKKVSALTEKEKANIVNNTIKGLETWWGFKKTREEMIRSVTELFEEQDDLFEEEKKTYTPTEYADKLIKDHTDELNDYRNNGFEAYLRYNDHLYTSCLKMDNGEYYIQIGFDTPFRVSSYPNNTFKSRTRLLAWLSKYAKEKGENMIGYYDEHNNFIQGFTEELVNRINNYYQLHGEKNLYFEFG